MKTTRSYFNLMIPLLCLGLLTAPTVQAQGKKGGIAKPAPDFADVKYGPYERNVFDLWKASTDKPAPLVVYIHGGGFAAGDKSSVSGALIQECLKRGIAVAAVRYRLSPEVHFPAHYMDCARAIQYMRAHAKEYNIDPKRIGATGGSAGAGTSLWLGFHDDMADPKSDDPVLRQSTRLTCMAVQAAQSSYDPRDIKRWIGGRADEHPALLGFYGLTREEYDTDKAHKLFEAAAPINYVTADDPPVWMLYSEPNAPLPENARPGQGIHHPKFGEVLKAKMDPLKIECTLHHTDEYKKNGSNPAKDMVDFFARHFGLSEGTGSAEPAKTKAKD